MGKSQRDKGARGERELSAKLAELFRVYCERTAQRCGKGGTADVRGLDGIHVESKRCEALSVYKAMDQAVSDAGDAVPLVCHRRNGRDWLAIVRLDDLPRLVERLYLVLAKGE